MRFQQGEISRFLGRLEKGLEMHHAIGHDNELAKEVANLEHRERKLAKLISKEGIVKRQKRALEKVSVLTEQLLPQLEAENPADPVELSITDLTLKVKRENRDDYLWEIGSGANWLAYHIAITLALQQFFIESEPSPVPSLLVYDQPSQVYFPRRLAGSRTTTVNFDPEFDDEDVIAVNKVFATIAGVVNKSSGRLQTLILDHAGPNVWENLEGVHLVEEWRQGKKLVPVEWL